MLDNFGTKGASSTTYKPTTNYQKRQDTSYTNKMSQSNNSSKKPVDVWGPILKDKNNFVNMHHC